MSHNALVLLREEFSDPTDLESRRRGASGLVLLSRACGTEKTCSELLPLVAELVQSSREQDDVSYAFVRSMEGMVTRVGSNYPALLAPLEALMTVEETTVRDRAVRLTNTVAQKLNASQVYQFLFPLLKRLAENEWFAPRRSACGLLVEVYTRVDSSHRLEVLEICNLLVADETPMVRRGVAAALGGMAGLQGAESIVASSIVNTWSGMCDDPVMSVRVACVSSAGAIALALGKERATNVLLPKFKSVATGKLWRSRASAATQLGVLAKAFGGGAGAQAHLEICVACLKDSEEDVIDNAINQMPAVAAAMKANGETKAFVESIIPVLEKLIQPPLGPKSITLRLRKSVARSALSMGQVDSNVGAKLVKVFETLLTDSDSKDAMDVRRIVLDGLPQIVSSLGSDFSFAESSKWGKILKVVYDSSKSSFVDEVNARHIAESAQAAGISAPNNGDAMPGEPVDTPEWRMRAALLRSLPDICKQDKAFAQSLWSQSLSDEAYEVRRCAGDILVKMCAEGSGCGGQAGVVKDFLPLLIQFAAKAKEGSYQLRITAMHCATVLSAFPSAWSAGASDIFGDALSDPVRNVALAALIEAKGNAVIVGKFKDKITKLGSSPDADVAAAALKAA